MKWYALSSFRQVRGSHDCICRRKSFKRFLLKRAGIYLRVSMRSWAAKHACQTSILSNPSHVLPSAASKAMGSGNRTFSVA